MLEHYEAVATLADIPRHQAARAPDRIALIAGDRRLTYAELAERSLRVASGLAGLGLGRGARVAVLAYDSESVQEILFGCAAAGAVLVPINWRLEASEVGYIVQNSDAELLFVSPELAPLVASFAADCPRLATIIELADAPERHPGYPTVGERSGSSGTPAGYPTVGERSGSSGTPAGYPTWRDQHPPAPAAVPAAPSDPVIQVYTSGTSGRPKGVVVSHGCFLDLLRDLERAGDRVVDWQPGDVTLQALPSFHIGGLWFCIHGLLNGATNVLLRVFNAAEALELIQRHSITKVAFVPAMLRFLLSEPTCETTDLSSVDQLVYGGSPMPRPLLERARAVFRCRFAQNYGLSETTNMAVFLPAEEHEDPANPRLKAAGKPLRGVSVRIVDPDGRDLPPGQTGEILFRTPGCMLEYWKRPEETAQAVVDGWLHTGDAGHLDEDGYVYVTDRIKDLIISAGENIYPAEIERVLVQHEGVGDVAVIGVPDDRWGEVPIALVVPRPGVALSKTEVMSFARKRLAGFKMLRTVEMVEALPRNPSGKVLKRVLRAPYWAGRDKQVN